MKRRGIQKFVIVTVLIVLFGWLILFFAKDWVVGIAIRNVQHKLKNKFNVELTIKKYELHGWSELDMEGMNCRTGSQDTLAYLDHIRLKIKLWPLITGKMRLEKMQLENGLIDLAQISRLRRKGLTPEIKDSNQLAKAQKYIRLLHDAANYTPDNFLAKNIALRYTDTSGIINGTIDSVAYVDSKLSTQSELTIDGQQQTWSATGTFDKGSLETHLKVKSNVRGFYELSMIKKLARAKIGFRSYSFDLDTLQDNGNDVYIKGALKAHNIMVYNPKISADTVLADSGGVDFSMDITAQKFILDSSSRLHLNGLTAMISSDYSYLYPAKIHALLELPLVPAQSVLDALPTGAFESVHSMTLKGDMGYHLGFYLDIDTKDSCHIDANVIDQGLKVVNYGDADLPKINGNFIYHPYDSKRPIDVDSANPEYTHLSAMPKYLIDAVVGSEDPNFLYNRGIETDAIEVSLLNDLKQHRFRQGGSTITMQLVKNVFLTHKKTLDRKMEEFFLVWLLENTHISTKNRILEVYLNVIEWGPDVYGIGEASKFYFNKKPSQLTLNESIFLAKIIPQPLGFMNRFDNQGNLKPNFQKKALTAVDRMARRGKLDVDEEGSYWPEVHITGPAKKLIKISPTVADSLRIQDSLDRENDW